MSINSLITNLDRALIDAREIEKESAGLGIGERKLDLGKPVEIVLVEGEIYE